MSEGKPPLRRTLFLAFLTFVLLPAAAPAGAMREGNFGMLDEAERKVPVALFVGTRDPFFPVPVVRATPSSGAASPSS